MQPRKKFFGESQFFILKAYKRYRETTTKEIMDTRFDFLNRATLSSRFVKKALHRISAQKGIAPSDISIMVIMKGESFHYFLYNGNQAVGPISFEEILSDNDMAELAQEGQQ
jgi:hypothetical protein